MKKAYETPSVEVVKFQYRDQVVALSADPQQCTSNWDGSKSNADKCTFLGANKGDY